MVETQSDNVPRTPDKPTADQVLDQMNPCTPYTVSDLVDQFEGASRWTLQRRLDSLVENGNLNKKKHAENRVTYWIDV